MKAEPKATDFPNSNDGQQQFLTALHKWEKEQKQGTGNREQGTEKPVEPAQPIGEGAQPAEPAAAQPEAAKPAVTATPQEIASLMEKNPALKAALDAAPEAKELFFANARELAAAKPVLDIVPSVDDAMFMQEHTAALVGMRTAAMMAVEDPANLPQFFNQFDAQFAVVDKDGRPVLDAQGKPTYAPDRDLVVNGMVTRELGQHGSRLKTEMEGLKQKLATGVYPNDAAKARDQKRFEELEWAESALAVVPAILDGSYFLEAAPEIPADATDAFKTWAEGERKRIADEAAALDEKKNGSKKEERLAEKQRFNSEIAGSVGGHVGKMIVDQIKSEIDAGVYIPEYMLQQKWIDPKTQQPTETADIAARLYLDFMKEVRKPGSRTLMTIADHELLPRNPQTRQMRETWYREQAAHIVPKLVRNEVDRIQKLVQVDQERQGKRLEQRNAVVQPEPVSSGSSLPQGASDEQIMRQAETNASSRPEWKSASPNDKQSMLLTERHRILARNKVTS